MDLLHLKIVNHNIINAQPFQRVPLHNELSTPQKYLNCLKLNEKQIYSHKNLLLSL